LNKEICEIGWDENGKDGTLKRTSLERRELEREEAEPLGISAEALISL